MDTSFKKLLALARKTGDPLIVLGTESEEACVILPVSRYEVLVDSRHPHPPVSTAAPAPHQTLAVSELLPPDPVASQETETQFYLEPVE